MMPAPAPSCSILTHAKTLGALNTASRAYHPQFFCLQTQSVGLHLRDNAAGLVGRHSVRARLRIGPVAGFLAEVSAARLFPSLVGSLPGLDDNIFPRLP